MATFAVYGGLGHITFFFRFLVVVVFYVLSYCVSCLYPVFISASLYSILEFLNMSSFADNCDNLNSIDFGTCLIMDSGWLDSMLT